MRHYLIEAVLTCGNGAFEWYCEIESSSEDHAIEQAADLYKQDHPGAWAVEIYAEEA